MFDYCGTQSSDGTCSLSPKRNSFFHEATIDRLLQYSIFGWDTLPTRRQSIDYYHTRSSDETRSLHLKGLFFLSARRQTIRPLQYSTYGSDMLSISQKDLYIHESTIGRLLIEHSTTMVLEETNQDSQHQGNQPIGRQLKGKYYTSEC